jgi:hypothetical protein
VHNTSARIGELWFCRKASGEPLELEFDKDVLLAIPAEARVFSAPEIAEIDAAEVSGESDQYSFALLLLYLFAGYVPDGSIENASNRMAAIRQLDPVFDEKLAEALAPALNPDINNRGRITTLLDQLGLFAQRLGITVSNEYYESPLSTSWMYHTESATEQQPN